MTKLIEDASGDSLDAFLCAWQAAWAWTKQDQSFGIPEYRIRWRVGSSIRTFGT